MLAHFTRGLLLVSLAGYSLGAVAQQSAEPSLEQLRQRVEALEQKGKTQQGLKVSGYIQLYYQMGQQDASLNLGGKQEDADRSYGRLGVRRGRAKLTYTKGLATGVLQIDMTERGVGLKDAYIRLALPQLSSLSLQAGLFDRPFGHEISYSSSKRESPERSIITPTLFPNERDLGVMLTLKGAERSALRGVRLDAGLFSGNGIKSDVDSRLDFIGRLSGTTQLSSDVTLSGGVSLYYGGVYQTTAERYRMVGSSFELESGAHLIGGYARRSYVGVDAQLGWRSPIGKGQLRAEWITGQQPGSATSHKSPNGSLQTTAMYLRPVQGGYVLLTQNVGKSPFALTAKYDWHDPNTSVKGDQIGSGHTGGADVAYRALGIGAMYQISDALRLTLYGQKYWNERSAQLPKYSQDRKDDRLTLALLYKF